MAIYNKKQDTFLYDPSIMPLSFLSLCLLYSVILIFICIFLNSSVGIILYFLHITEDIIWHKYSEYLIIGYLSCFFICIMYDFFHVSKEPLELAKYYHAEPINKLSAVAEEINVLQLNQNIAKELNYPQLPLYVLRNEVGINSFSIGLLPEKSIMVFTWGAIYHLTEYELITLIKSNYHFVYSGQCQYRTRFKLLGSAFYFLARCSDYISRKGNQYYQSSSYIKKNISTLLFFIGYGLKLLNYLDHQIYLFIKRILFKSFIFKWDQLQFKEHGHHYLSLLSRMQIYSVGSYIYHQYTADIDCLYFANSTQEMIYPPLTQRLMPYLSEQQKKLVQLHELMSFDYDWYQFIGLTQESHYTPLDDQQYYFPTQLYYIQRVYKQEIKHKDTIRPLRPEYRQTQAKHIVNQLTFHTQAHYLHSVKFIFLSRQLSKEQLMQKLETSKKQDISEQDELSCIIMEYLLNIDTRLYVSLFNEVIRYLKLPKTLAKEKLLMWLDIIKWHGKIHLLDALLLEKVKAQFGMLPVTVPYTLHEVIPDIVHLLDDFIYLQHNSKSAHEFREIILKQAFGDQQWQLYQTVSDYPVDIFMIFHRLAGLEYRERLTLLNVLEYALWQTGSLTQEGLDVLVLMYWRLGFDYSKIEQQMYRRNQIMIW